MAETTRLREIYMTEELKRDMKTTRRVVATAKQLLGLENTAELSCICAGTRCMMTVKNIIYSKIHCWKMYT